MSRSNTFAVRGTAWPVSFVQTDELLLRLKESGRRIPRGDVVRKIQLRIGGSGDSQERTGFALGSSVGQPKTRIAIEGIGLKT